MGFTAFLVLFKYLNHITFVNSLLHRAIIFNLLQKIQVLSRKYCVKHVENIMLNKALNSDDVTRVGNNVRLIAMGAQ